MCLSLIIVIIFCFNKMQLFWNRIKTQPILEYHPKNQFFNLSQRSGNKFDAAKHILSSSKVLTSRNKLKMTQKDRGIRQENIRLISKLMEIGTRKSRIKTQDPPSIPKRRENSEQQRLITLQNQRLGRSLVRIKSGKSVDRVKNDIARSLAKLNRKKKKAQQSNRLSTQRNDPQVESSCRNISQLSKCQNLPKKLTRARLMGAAELLQFKRCFI